MTLVSLACTALLAACGSGGGDGGNAEGRLQVINFSYPGGNTLLNGPTALSATASSGLPVTFRSGTPATCTVEGNQLTLVAAGECLVIASQAGGASSDGVKWAVADELSHLFNVLKHAHEPVLPMGVMRHAGTETVSLSPVTVAGVPATYTSETEAVCTVSGTTLTVKASGLCNLRVKGAETADYVAMNGLFPVVVSPVP